MQRVFQGRTPKEVSLVSHKPYRMADRKGLRKREWKDSLGKKF